jgi:probable addiction module antidote protein
METMAIERVTFAEYDPAEYINDRECVIAFIGGSLERNETDFVLETLGHITRSEGFSEIARERGVSREALLQSIAPDGNLTLDSVVKLADLLGYRLKLERKTA